jgi:predicted  nucleic acid-binding Zn-ribbon protein|tara:strand:+ start:448 stop:732 length:285 start_codon:yes stop_codon:yes gene_type:complete
MITKEEAIAFEKQIEDINTKEDRGPSDLELRIEDLMRINLSHQNLNADLRKEISFLKKRGEHFEYMYNQLKKEKEDLHEKGQSMLNEFRNKGDV